MGVKKVSKIDLRYLGDAVTQTNLWEKLNCSYLRYVFFNKFKYLFNNKDF